ncbi:MAG: DUF4013 domain-containing protein [Chloroflexales bacterium]
MDIGRAFSYVFDDDEWLTVILLGGLIAIVPIFGQIVLVGFLFETARNVAAGNSRPLPKWNHLGDTFSLGLSGILIQIVYALPIVLLSCAFGCLMAAGAGTLSRQESAVGGGIMLTFLCLLPLLTLVSLIVQPLTLGAMVRYIQTGSLGAALRVGAVASLLRSDMGGWLLLWLLQILCGVVGGLGSVFFGVGAAFTMAYATAVFGHLLGQKITRTPPPTL